MSAFFFHSFCWSFFFLSRSHLLFTQNICAASPNDVSIELYLNKFFIKLIFPIKSAVFLSLFRVINQRLHRNCDSVCISWNSDNSTASGYHLLAKNDETHSTTEKLNDIAPFHRIMMIKNWLNLLSVSSSLWNRPRHCSDRSLKTEK